MSTYGDYLRTQQQPITISQAAEQPKESDRAHLFSLRAGLGLPLLQAAATGLLFGSGISALSWALEYEYPGKLFVASGLMITAVIWALLLMGWLRLTAPLERLTGLDIDQDGYIGDPEPGEPETIRIELMREGHMKYIDLPYPERLPKLASDVLDGVPLTVSSWTGADNPFSRAEWQQLTAVLLKRELVEWKNDQAHAQGLKLTENGAAVFEALAVHHTSPTNLPESEGWRKRG